MATDWEAERQREREAAERSAARLNAIAEALLPLLPEPGRYGWHFPVRSTVDEHRCLRFATVCSRDATIRIVISDDVHWTKRHVRGMAYVTMPSALRDGWSELRHLHRDKEPGEEGNGRGPETTCGFALDRAADSIAREILRRSVLPALAWAPGYLATVDRLRREVRDLEHIGRSVLISMWDGAVPNEHWAQPKAESDGRRVRIHSGHRRIIGEADLYLDRATFTVSVPGRLAAALAEHLVAFEREHLIRNQETTAP